MEGKRQEGRRSLAGVAKVEKSRRNFAHIQRNRANAGKDTMILKKLFPSVIAVLFLASTAAYAADDELPPEAPPPPPSIRVTPPPVPPLGWVYNYYAPCADPRTARFCCQA